jgi:hypothetical protein
MSELFMSASRVLRDDLVCQLEKENNFLKELLVNKKNGESIFYGKAVTIKSYRDISDNVIPSKKGFFLDILLKYPSQCHILYKKENNKQEILTENLRNVEFDDEIKI